MNGIKIETIYGKVTYTKITAEPNYSFYDIDAINKIYMQSITTPITDSAEIARKYIPAWGNAEDLNAKLEEERQKAVEDDGSRI